MILLWSRYFQLERLNFNLNFNLKSGSSRTFPNTRRKNLNIWRNIEWPSNSGKFNLKISIQISNFQLEIQLESSYDWDFHVVHGDSFAQLSASSSDVMDNDPDSESGSTWRLSSTWIHVERVGFNFGKYGQRWTIDGITKSEETSRVTCKIHFENEFRKFWLKSEIRNLTIDDVSSFIFVTSIPHSSWFYPG